MRSFYGGTYIGKEILANNNIYHPVRLEYYKTEETKNLKTIYGIEVVKTEYKGSRIEIENKVINQITNEENVINEILEQFKDGEITPALTEEMLGEMLKN